MALSFFILLLIGTGGNSGSQTTSTIVRAIETGEVHARDRSRLLWHSGIPLARAIAIVLLANIFGALLPPMASDLRIEPSIPGPLCVRVVDATGLIIYVLLARWVIGI